MLQVKQQSIKSGQAVIEMLEWIVLLLMLLLSFSIERRRRRTTCPSWVQSEPGASGKRLIWERKNRIKPELRRWHLQVPKLLGLQFRCRLWHMICHISLRGEVVILLKKSVKIKNEAWKATWRKEKNSASLAVRVTSPEPSQIVIEVSLFRAFILPRIVTAPLWC